jgi:hypothetical protein
VIEEDEGAVSADAGKKTKTTCNKKSIFVCLFISLEQTRLDAFMKKDRMSTVGFIYTRIGMGFL